MGVIKNVLKVCLLLLIGLFVALSIYPMIHEAGHALMAFCVGAKIEEFNLLPLPSVLCDTENIGKFRSILIGYGGIIVPTIISILAPSRHFIIWYSCLLLKGINALAIGISLLSLIFYMNGVPVQNDDITTILMIDPSAISMTTVFLVFCLSLTILSLIREKVINKCYCFFYN